MIALFRRDCFAFRALAALFLASAALPLAGCQRDLSPELLQISDMAPSEAEVGERLEVVGTGFPQGRKARVTFRGTLFRPGDDPVTSAEAEAEGQVTGPESLEIPFTDALETQFCGIGEARVHTTFEGSVEVAFAAARAGAPPVVGTLGHVTLDVRPPMPRTAIVEAAAAQGNRVLDSLGIHVDAALPPAGGLLVARIEPRSRAEEAGLVAGDVVMRVDGAFVHGPPDVRLVGRKAEAHFVVRREGASADVVKTVNVAGIVPQSPKDLIVCAAILLVALALILFLVGPPVAAVTWLERRVAARIAAMGTWRRRGAGAGSRAGAGHFQLPLPGPALAALGIGLPGVLVLASAIGFDPDIGIFYLLIVTSIVVLAFLEGSGGKLGNVGRASRASLRALCHELPGAAAVASVILMTGSLRLADVVAAQGGWPWRWFAFANPIALLQFIGMMVSAYGPGVRRQGRGATAITAVVHRYAVTTLAVALFLGGWQLPGMGPGEQAAHAGLVALGAGLFMAKTLLVIAALHALEWALDARPSGANIAPGNRAAMPDGRAFRGIVVARAAPVAVAMLGATAAWVTWGPAPATARLFGVGTFAVVCLAGIHFASRVRYHLRGAGSGVALNPFL